MSRTTRPSLDQPVSRRKVLQLVGLSAAAAAAWRLGVRFDDAGITPAAASSAVLMGTLVNISVIDEDQAAAQAAVTATLDDMRLLEDVLSRHRADSQLGRLNSQGRVDGADPALLTTLRSALEIGGLSRGAFDVTIKPVLDRYERAAADGRLPESGELVEALELVGQDGIRIDGDTITFDRPGMAVTLDSIGKGYIVDEAVATLRRAGYADVLVEAGGDLLASGRNQDGDPWRVGLQPARSGDEALRVAVADQAVATSGDYMKAFSSDLANHHIIDPRTGTSPVELAGASVVAPTAAMADGLATAVMVLGPTEGLRLVDGLAGVEASVSGKDGRIRTSAGFGSVSG